MTYHGLVVYWPSPHRAEVFLIMKQKATQGITLAFSLDIMIVVMLFLIFTPRALLEGSQGMLTFFFAVLSLLSGLRIFSFVCQLLF